jgi:hypothetical protein
MAARPIRVVTRLKFLQGPATAVDVDCGEGLIHIDFGGLVDIQEQGSAIGFQVYGPDAACLESQPEVGGSSVPRKRRFSITPGKGLSNTKSV